MQGAAALWRFPSPSAVWILRGRSNESQVCRSPSVSTVSTPFGSPLFGQRRVGTRDRCRSRDLLYRWSRIESSGSGAMSRVSGFFLPVILAMSLLPPLMAQQDHATLERGFQPGKLYQFGNLDAVNVFNGNLVIMLPIGPTYPLNGGLSYGLTLSYNSKIWDLTDGQGGQRARPSARSNAGSGWLVGIGHEIYEAPDGGDHRFDGIRLTDSASGACMSVATTDADRCPLYTLDGTSLRLRYFINAREIDFPDGTTRRFEKDPSSGNWRLRTIRNALGDESVSITYSQGSPPPQCVSPNSFWTITAPRQTSYVCFKDHTVSALHGPMVDKVVLRSVGGTTGSTAVYEFKYTDHTDISEPAENTEPPIDGLNNAENCFIYVCGL